MIDIEAMERDPWPTWPVKKDDIRALGKALQEMEAVNALQFKAVIKLHQAMMQIIDTDPALIGSAKKMWDTAFYAVKELDQ